MKSFLLELNNDKLGQKLFLGHQGSILKLNF